MKLTRLEVSGFRGIRGRADIWFPSGFTVIVGRNGAGKSTLCDAIEYALTGSITKHRCGSEKGENIEQYLWWRGTNPPEERYVSLTLVDADGREYPITRRPDGKDPDALRTVTPLLCRQAVDPAKKPTDVCVASIIRDELITELSVDMTELERFEFVRSAVGSANLGSLEARLDEVQKALERQIDSAEREYERVRDRVVQIVADISRLRTESPVEREVQAIESRLRAKLGLPAAEPGQLVNEARRVLSALRLRVERGSQLLNRIEARLRSGAPQSDAALESDYLQVEIELRRAEAELSALQQTVSEFRRLARELETESGASSLAELHRHGSDLGLADGRCPLCGSLISEEEFRRHLRSIKAGLQEAAVRLADARSRLGAAEEAERGKNQSVLELRTAVGRLEASLQEIRALREQVKSDRASLGIEPSANDWDAAPVASWLDLQRRELNELETSIVSLEAAQQLSRVSDREKELDVVQQASRSAERRLEETRRAASRAKSAIDTLRRISGEIVDERLAAISPLLEELYSRLRPHIDWPEISYLVRGDVRRLLSLRVGAGLNLRYMFSSGQRRAAGLAFLLAVSLSRPWCGFRSLILDDPVQHIDDYRAMHLVETLAAVRRTGLQVICTVEDAALAELLTRRLRSTQEDAGALVELEYQPGEGGRVLREKPIVPFASQVLLSA
jgi:DNA repair exonuclease SbcCD ATPase subunit